MIYLYMCFTIFLSACNISTDKTYLYVEVDTLPVLEYENGLNDYIYSNLKWPNQFGGEGEVIASFIVTQGGKTNKIKIEKSLCPLCDEEVIRVLKSLPKWKPGEKDGEQVNVKFYLPIKFNIEQ